MALKDHFVKPSSNSVRPLFIYNSEINDNQFQYLPYFHIFFNILSFT